MHMFSVDHGFYGGHGIVGAQVPLGTGLAFKHKYAEDGGVCLTYIGDGAVNQGQVYEAFNMAKLWDLPVIYAIENNQYAMGTSIKRSSAEPLLYRRGEAHRIPGLQVDGMDVLAVRGAAEVALEWTRGGKGPIILEFLTYRYRGHSMSDPAKYRTREEVQDVREHHDPIDHAERELEAMGVKEDELKAIDKEIKDIVVEAAKFAEDAPEPAAGRALHRRAGGELLMAIELKMPALSPTMEEGTLAKWLVKEGDEVKSGDILAEIETDKATMEFEAVDEGKIAKILVPEGTDGVKVGAADRAACRRMARRSAMRRLPRRLRREAAQARDRQREPSVPEPASQQDEATPTPHVFETAARDLVADVAATHDEPEVPEGTPLVTHDRARGAARRDGRGDARATSACS